MEPAELLEMKIRVEILSTRQHGYLNACTLYADIRMKTILRQLNQPKLRYDHLA
jgi:hypothetical protein